MFSVYLTPILRLISKSNCIEKRRSTKFVDKHFFSDNRSSTNYDFQTSGYDGQLAHPTMMNNPTKELKLSLDFLLCADKILCYLLLYSLKNRGNILFPRQASLTQSELCEDKDRATPENQPDEKEEKNHSRDHQPPCTVLNESQLTWLNYQKYCQEEEQENAVKSKQIALDVIA